MKNQQLNQKNFIKLQIAFFAKCMNGNKLNRYLFVLSAFTLSSMPLIGFAATGKSLGSGRLLPTLAIIAALVGILIGRQALLRFNKGMKGKSRAVLAVLLGLISLVVGASHAANSVSGFGTGNGRAGAIVAILLGAISAILGGRYFAKLKRMENSDIL